VGKISKRICDDYDDAPNGVPEPCRLCSSGGLSFVGWDNQPRKRPLYLCRNCGLISVPAEYHLSVSDELSRYALHDNSLSNQGYVDFLTEVADVAVSVASGMPHGGLSMSDPREPPIKLLDFGCGKEAALCRLLGRRGIDCYPYDPLYDNLQLPADGGYDIIVACEVVEHLRNLAEELRLIDGLLRSGGVFILRTRLYDDADVNINTDVNGGDTPIIQHWWYMQDPTHINFFNKTSLFKLASIIDKRLEETERRDIFVLR